MEEFTVGKNLELAIELQGKTPNREEVLELLKKVDLDGFYKRKQNQFSGGQKQRVAIARALIKDPEIIMADEPTGALDSNTGKQVMDTLKKLSRDKLIIIVSHDREFAEIYGDRIIELKDGKIIKDETKIEVEAKRISSGVNIIEDKIIHIKKGQTLSKFDLLEITTNIMKHSKEKDTIISFDYKANESVKKSAFITADGNSETFIKTNESNLKLKEYNPKNFKLIKSRFKFKDSFKMGVSSLKHKTLRLIFTIFMSMIAFSLFGLSDVLASYNRATSVYEYLNMTSSKTVVASKVYSGNNYLMADMPNRSLVINEKEYTKLKNTLICLLF